MSKYILLSLLGLVTSLPGSKAFFTSVGFFEQPNFIWSSSGEACRLTKHAKVIHTSEQEITG